MNVMARAGARGVRGRGGTGVRGQCGSQGVGWEAVSSQPGFGPEIPVPADSQSLLRWVGRGDGVGRGVQAGGRGGGAREGGGCKAAGGGPPRQDERSEGGGGRTMNGAEEYPSRGVSQRVSGKQRYPRLTGVQTGSQTCVALGAGGVGPL